MATELESLREIGWAAWDPTGIRDLGGPRDEYDRYLIEAASRFRAGQPVANVAAYLDQIAGDIMALGPGTAMSRAASLRTAILIESYIASLSRG